jgi:3-deoxy-D-manno-oct-2-ulosonic acid (Kdo) hydroxylase
MHFFLGARPETNNMTNVVSVPIAIWDHQYSAAEQEYALYALEQGSVLYFPQLRFSIDEVEGRLLSPTIAGKSKNVSLDCSSGTLRGSSAGEAELRLLRSMMQRFATSSGALLRNLLPRYKAGSLQGRTSFRPVEIAKRSTSWRNDDTRLHVDRFPSSPVRDKRILRLFSNVNPHGQSRTWRLGDSFESVARRYLPSTRGPVWGVSQLLSLLGITKSRRSAYDHFMLQLHDRMKADLDYQSEVDQIVFEFHAGSTWIAFTDQVSHAAMRGQYALEQTFYLPVTCMLDPSQAPLRILERLAGRELT